MEKIEKRKRGAPVGNKNALKHGFYSKIFDRADKRDFERAAGIEGIDEEIALMRLKIKRAIKCTINKQDYIEILRKKGLI
jgi:hypothetical protein